MLVPMRNLTATGKLGAAGLLLVLTSIAFAQTTPQDSWIRVTTVHVKPDMVQEWREIYKNDIVPAYKKAEVPRLTVWSTSMFGDSSEYTLVMPITKFAQFDGDSPLVKTMKPEDRVRLGDRLSKCVSSSRSEGLMNDAGTSIVKDMQALPELIMVSRIELEPKNVNAYMSFLKEEAKPLMQKAGVDWWLVYRDVFGAPRTQVITVRSMKNWAEIDAGPPARRLLSAPDYAKYSEKGNALIESSSISMAHIVKELSY